MITIGNDGLSSSGIPYLHRLIFTGCKSRLSSRHDSGLKSGIVFDENDPQAPQANESPLTCLTKTRLELFCCREHFSFHTQGDGFFPTQTVRRTPQVEDLAMMKQAINNRHH